MIAFTICSNNYLPQAAALRGSLNRFHPDWKFVLALVDQVDPALDYHRFGFDTILPVADLNLAGFKAMAAAYDLVELNTALKPFFFDHLFKTYPQQEHILYLDPDIQVFSDLSELQSCFSTASILLVPHFSTPHQGQPGIITPERRVLQRGLYNLGFLGLKRSPSAQALLAWWQQKLLHHCRVQPEKGLFVDQKWLDLAPIYFPEAKILTKSGYNVAYWNLYENPLHRRGDIYVTGEVPLRFYHFSAFEFDNPHYITNLARPFPAEMAEIIQEIYTTYHTILLNNGLLEFQHLPCAFAGKPSFSKRLKKTIYKNILKFLNL